MKNNTVLSENNVAVITGGADGIGFASAQYFRSIGMRVCIADIDDEKLGQAADALGDVLAVPTDVSSLEAVEALRDRVYQDYGQVDLLMNNAGSGFGTSSWTEYENWQRTLEVNLFGVINGVHTFVPAMLQGARPGLVINTGSKQGITNPPGDPAYNTSKAAIKTLTEQLQHSFRSSGECRLSAHLLVPGFTYTGIVKQWLDTKPDGAWLPEQVVQFMTESLQRGDFYILCPDNDTTPEMDKKRMTWAMGDLTENRPALSRWHESHTAAFERFMED